MGRIKNKKKKREMKIKIKKDSSFLKTDGFSVFLIIIALITALMIPYMMTNSNYSLNSGMLIYVAVATIIASLIDPMLTLTKIEKSRTRKLSVSIGVICGFVLFFITLYDQTIFNWIESFSSRGGFTAISITLLVLKLAELNYDLKIDEEDERHKKDQEKDEKNLEELRMIREELNKVKRRKKDE